MSFEYRFLRPVDVLYLRGNRLFGEAGEYAEASMPPWPSLFAGALRSRMLVDLGIDLAEFSASRIPHSVLGTPATPGPFRIAEVALARIQHSAVERLFTPPSDLVAIPGSDGGGADSWMPHLLQPVPSSDLSPILTSLDKGTSCLPLLQIAQQKKPKSDVFLRECGLAKYLRGELPSSTDFVSRHSLWKTDPRLGIGLDSCSRTAAAGRIYTTDAVAFCRDVGFLVGVAGANGLVPSTGLVRLGGDGRGAAIEHVMPDKVQQTLPIGPRFKMILATPGIFSNGWLPPGIEDVGGKEVLAFKGLKAKLQASAMPRHQVISGWDIALRKPKPAERVAPAGSVYWFETIEGSTDVLAELVDEGLWPLLHSPDLQRRAEGFNNVWFGDWK